MTPTPEQSIAPAPAPSGPGLPMYRDLDRAQRIIELIDKEIADYQNQPLTSVCNGARAVLASLQALRRKAAVIAAEERRA